MCGFIIAIVRLYLKHDIQTQQNSLHVHWFVFKYSPSRIKHLKTQYQYQLREVIFLFFSISVFSEFISIEHIMSPLLFFKCSLLCYVYRSGRIPVYQNQ